MLIWQKIKKPKRMMLLKQHPNKCKTVKLFKTCKFEENQVMPNKTSWMAQKKMHKLHTKNWRRKTMTIIILWMLFYMRCNQNLEFSVFSEFTVFTEFTEFTEFTFEFLELSWSVKLIKFACFLTVTYNFQLLFNLKMVVAWIYEFWWFWNFHKRNWRKRFLFKISL